MSTDITRIAINTGGGDAPGLNAVIHAAVYAARAIGWEVFGIREGYDGLMFGAAAVRVLAEGQNGVMVALNPPRIDYVPLKQAVARMKTVPPNSNGIVTARALDISFSD